MSLWETITDLQTQSEALRHRAHGVIEAVEGRFRQVTLRPFPKVLAWPESVLLPNWTHRHQEGDRCWLYYNQPRSCPGYLALKHIVTTRGASLASLCRALETLDELARLKRADALVCDVLNLRVSDRCMGRLGWTPHCPSRWHRHYIKRFYGQYPPGPVWLAGPSGKSLNSSVPPECRATEMAGSALVASLRSG